MLELGHSSAGRVSRGNCMLDYSLGSHFLDDKCPALNKQNNDTDKAKMTKRSIIYQNVPGEWLSIFTSVLMPKV